jgi:hypothetical protein
MLLIVMLGAGHNAMHHLLMPFLLIELRFVNRKEIFKTTLNNTGRCQLKIQDEAGYR